MKSILVNNLIKVLFLFLVFQSIKCNESFDFKKDLLIFPSYSNSSIAHNKNFNNSNLNLANNLNRRNVTNTYRPFRSTPSFNYQYLHKLPTTAKFYTNHFWTKFNKHQKNFSFTPSISHIPTIKPFTLNKYEADCACKKIKFQSSSDNSTNDEDSIRQRFRRSDKLDSNQIINSRIINGTNADFYRFPYIVSLGKAINNQYTNESHYCGGTLISPYWIITAAHCLSDFKPKKLLVGYGEGNRTKMKKWIEADRLVVHPRYTGWPKYLNDIGLVKLKQPIAFNSSIKPGCLHSSFIRLRKEFTGIGWGRTGFEDDFANQLQKNTFEYIPLKECKEKWSKEIDHPDLTTNNICVYHANTDICNGDSGSPLINIAENGISYIVGVASFTNFCDKTQPAVYVRIFPYIDWVISVVQSFC